MKQKLLFSLKLLISLSMIAVSFTGFTQSTNVPDNFFESYLEHHNANGEVVAIVDPTSMGNGVSGDDYVLTSRINTVTNLNVSGRNISDLTGIEDFMALTELDCSDNNLTSLNISSNTALATLSCYLNDITNLDLSSNSVLMYVSCYSNELVTLDMSGNPLLTYLSCDYNSLTSLDVSTNSALTYLSCFFNDLTTLDISTSTLLTELYCDKNNLNALDLANNTALIHLQCFENNLTSLDVSNNTLLEDLSCHDNNLDALDVSNNTQLTYLSCYSNNISSLDVSNNTLLTYFRCFFNNISSLDVSNNPALTFLNCQSNNLTNLNVKNGTNENITYFNAKFNPNLTCIQVDDVAYSDVYWYNIDSQSYFSENCAVDITYLPDSNFEQTLIDLGYDDVLDGYVLTTNINTISVLYLAFEGINDLTGIEDFSALESLICNDNNLSALDVSNNLALIYLACYNNNLGSLDVSNNTALTFLSCANNNLTSLNVQNGTNLNITPSINFNALNNPDLFCIQVDDALWSTANWPNIDDQSYFDEDCALSVSENILSSSLTIYPNPVTDNLNIDLKNNLQLKLATIYSISGVLVMQTTKTKFNLEGLQSGFYILQIETNRGTVHKKILKN